ncbi:MAG: TonB-dependent receptor [Deltaproteobacteria bacterium]|jgi:vitamin B12 transporter|nr:TonB-dependent receptor [Deltaproteobacteria bacterium]
MHNIRTSPKAHFRPSAILTITAFAAILLVPLPAPAQTGDVLSPTVVVGRRIEEKLSAELGEYGHQVTVVQGEDIIKQGYTDLNEALAKMVPGLIVLNKGRGDYNSFFLNGNRNVLWLMDGVRLNNRLYGGAYVDTIGIHMVERVEVLTGGEGLFYGTESANGVVNIITKKPTQNLSGEVGAAIGTKGYYDTHAMISGGSGRHRFLAAAAYDTWNGYMAYDKRPYELYNNPDPRRRTYDRLNVTLKYETEFYLEGHNNLSVSLIRNQGGFDYAAPDRIQSTNNRVEHVGILKWDHDVTSNYSYYVKAYYHSWWTKYDRWLATYVMQNDKDLWGFQDWGINFLNSIRSDSGHELLLGYDYQNYWARDEVWKIDPMHEQVHAVFFQFRPHFSFWEDWKLALGARYNHSDAGSSFIWNVSSKVPILDGGRLSLRANVGTSFILPTAEQLFLNEPPDQGNPNLKPQRSFSATVGLVSQTEMFDFDIGVFYERITDRIMQDNDWVFQNAAGKTVIKGGTVSAVVRPLEGLSLSASFTAQGATLVNPDGVKVKRMANQPRDYLKLGLQYDGDIGNGQKFGIGIYSTRMGHIYSNQAARRGPDDPWVDYGNYWLVDANLYYKPVESVRITLSLANIFDKKYAPSGITSRNDPQDPKGFIYYNNPNGTPFAATLGVTYSY